MGDGKKRRIVVLACKEPAKILEALNRAKKATQDEVVVITDERILSDAIDGFLPLTAGNLLQAFEEPPQFPPKGRNNQKHPIPPLGRHQKPPRRHGR